jgi:hypothetical protein
VLGDTLNLRGAEMIFPDDPADHCPGITVVEALAYDARSTEPFNALVGILADNF